MKKTIDKFEFSFQRGGLAADSPEMPRVALRSPSRWLESASQPDKAGHWLVEVWLQRGLGQ